MIIPLIVWTFYLNNYNWSSFLSVHQVAEERADIAPLLDVNDMIMMKNKADPKSIFCYLSEVFRKLRKLDWTWPNFSLSFYIVTYNCSFIIL